MGWPSYLLMAPAPNNEQESEPVCPPAVGSNCTAAPGVDGQGPTATATPGMADPCKRQEELKSRDSIPVPAGVEPRSNAESGQTVEDRQNLPRQDQQPVPGQDATTSSNPQAQENSNRQDAARTDIRIEGIEARQMLDNKAVNEAQSKAESGDDKVTPGSAAGPVQVGGTPAAQQGSDMSDARLWNRSMKEGVWVGSPASAVMEENEPGRRPRIELSSLRSRSDADTGANASADGSRAMMGWESWKAAPVAAGVDGEVAVHHAPVLLPPSPSLEDLLRTQLVQVRDIKASEMSLTARPIDGMELALRVQNREGVIEVSGQCQSGDINAIQAEWDRLRVSLAGQGVILAPLTTTVGGNAANSFGGQGFAGRGRGASESGTEADSQSRRHRPIEVVDGAGPVPAPKGERLVRRIPRRGLGFELWA